MVVVRELENLAQPTIVPPAATFHGGRVTDAGVLIEKSELLTLVPRVCPRRAAGMRIERSSFIVFS
jgi:hypothetical protein